LAPSWELAAKQLKGVVKVGAVDMTTDENVGRPYGIQGFPTLKFFGNDKDKPIAYESGRDADSIRKWAFASRIGVNNQLSECSRKIKQELRQRKQGKEERGAETKVVRLNIRQRCHRSY